MTEQISLPETAAFTKGVYTQVLNRPAGDDKRPALFLDRDGAVVVEAHYLHEVDKVKLIEGAAETIRAANELGIPVIFVTNQAGVGYGYFGWDAFLAVQERILGDLAELGASVDGVYACPFHEKGKPPYDHPDHPARKPNPGMLLSAADAMNIDLGRSWIVGDRAGDIGAGFNAGLRGGIHVLTGHGEREGEREQALDFNDERFRSIGADSIAGVPDLIDLFN
ncbi:MAG: HAD family hydrolase [Rhodospirillaceae bacterium]|nr:HAD family hydrolase [Rhodospirillaceae bacterium]